MKKLLATLVAGLFAVGAFAQTGTGEGNTNAKGSMPAQAPLAATVPAKTMPAAGNGEGSVNTKGPTGAHHAKRHHRKHHGSHRGTKSAAAKQAQDAANQTK